MTKTILYFLLLFTFVVQPFKGSSQAANTQDSLALVDLYNNTNGSGWINHTNWLTTAPLSTWFGLYLIGDRVNFIHLGSNKLTGTLPATLDKLTNLKRLDLRANYLMGNIPASLANFSELRYFDLSYNQLSGSVPSFANITSFLTFSLANNQFTFSGMEGLDSNPSITGIYTPQADIPLIRDGNTLSVAAGGTKANNTYRWYKGNTLVSTKVGDSTFTISSPGDYSVDVVNSKAHQLTLYSITTPNAQDSLALVDLYNSTNGAGWTKNNNWLTTAPLATWYGVTVRRGIVLQVELVANNLIGNIPTSLGNLTKLETLNLSYNQLSGSIPSFLFANLSRLLNLRLNNNQLTGSIPSTIGNLSNLGVLNLNANQLTGSIPAELGNISGFFTAIFLNHNQLSGQIPASIGNLTSLRYFEANNNQLSGSLPASLGKLAILSQLDLSNNQLIGAIPDSICKISGLAVLNLAHNQLSGKLPDSIGSLAYLANLAINHNNLSGRIPSLAGLIRLYYLEIDNNQFTFNGMENLPTLFGTKSYSPQATIPLIKTGSELSVSAGGTLSNNTFNLYKDGVLSATQTGDSTFTISGRGSYYITVTNALATQLTLKSDTVVFITMLAGTTTSINQAISGTAPIDINDGNLRLVTLTPATGSNPLNGNVTTLVTIDDIVATHNGFPYVQRHYDITPVTNAASAQATVTLYYSQQDFDNYNAYVTSHNLNIPLLPVNGVDNGNIRISQFHGSFTGTSNPANYSNGAVSIIPNVVWDNVNQWWAVTFPVAGFSGFYLSTSNVMILPLTLLQFKGILQNRVINLQWATANEINTRLFDIERSSDGVLFTGIGKVVAESTTSTHSYSFSDGNPSTGNNFYRLKIVDRDAKFTYSPTVSIVINQTPVTLYAYPNPAYGRTSLVFHGSGTGKYQIEVADLSGKVLTRYSGAAIAGINKVAFDTQHYSKGIYIITFIHEKEKQSFKLTKQ